MDAIDVLLGLGNEEGADPRATAAALRGQRDLGQFLGLSTIDPVARMGQSNIRQATQAANRGGVLREAMARRAQREAEQQQAQENWQQDYERGAMESDRSYGLQQQRLAQALRARQDSKAAAELDYQRDLEKEQREADRRINEIELRAKLSGEGGVKLSATERGKLKTIGAAMDTGREAIEQLKANPGAISKWTDIGSRGLRMLPLIGSALAPDLQKSQKSPEEMAARTKLQFWVEKTRRALAGANLTAMEQRLSEETYDPSAPGIDFDEALRRANVLQQDLQNQISQYEGYGGVNESPPGSGGVNVIARPPAVPEETWLELSPEEQRQVHNRLQGR